MTEVSVETSYRLKSFVAFFNYKLMTSLLISKKVAEQGISIANDTL